MELLSNKREAFCRYIAIDGLTASDSYRKAFNSNPINQSSIHEQASKLLKDNKVATRIEALKLDISEKIASEIVFDKQRIISELHVNMLLGRETKQLAASNQAIKLIGSAVGSIFEPDTVAVSVTGSVLHGLSDDVLDQLASLASEPDAIDDTAAIEAESYQILDPEPEPEPE
jgi:hypothetical protein